MVGWNILLILAVVIPFAGRILSAPTIAYKITTTTTTTTTTHASNYVNPVESPESRLATTRATTITGTLRPSVSTMRGRDDHNVSLNEYRQVLDHLLEEAEAYSATRDYDDYNDEPMADILHRIIQAGSITSTLPSGIGSTSGSIPRLVADNIGDGSTEPYEAMDMSSQTNEKGPANQLANQDPVDDEDRRETIHGPPGVSQHDGCPICFEPMVEAAVDPNRHVITLFCGHKFHTKCIYAWALRSYNSTARCPICWSVLS